MLAQIKNKINRGLVKFIQEIDADYSLSKISPLLFNSIKDFLLRDGKRIRPILFCVGYLGFTKKPALNLYKGALSWELLHDFLLVHDDIIDKSNIRRGEPSMHQMLNKYLKGYKNLKFNGQDLAIVIGDIMYAFAINALLSIKQKGSRKEKALKRFIEATIYTGSGEFIELLYGLENLEKIKKEQIYRIYDYKTAQYTFASPLATGAILAGEDKGQIDKLLKYGVCLGRAFQIKDDILGLFSEERKIGKSILSDLQEAKKTILIWYAYNNSTKENKSTIRIIFTKEKVNKTDLIKIRKLVSISGALDYAKREITFLSSKAENLIASTAMYPRYKEYLNTYAQEILKL